MQQMMAVAAAAMEINQVGNYIGLMANSFNVYTQKSHIDFRFKRLAKYILQSFTPVKMDQCEEWAHTGREKARERERGR